MKAFFRRAAPAHLDTLIDFMRAYYAFDGIPFDPVKQRSALSGLMANPQHGRAWLIEYDGQIVGYMAVCFGYSLEFGGRDAFVDELYLLPHMRGKGIGAEAMRVMLETCRTNGIQAVHLEVSPENEAALASYRKAGFERRPFTLMSKDLSG